MHQEYIDETAEIEKVFPETTEMGPFAASDLARIMGGLIGIAELGDQFKKHIAYGKLFDESGALLLAEKKSADLDEISDAVCDSQTALMISQQDMRLLHGALGLYTEAAEMLEAVFKGIFSDDDLDMVNVLEELGDAHFYMGVMHRASGIPVASALHANLNKLIRGDNARYKDGFSGEAAENRDVAGEREGLEGAMENAG